jgi:pyruvate dehydrogenase E2 component (dihydrolipoamide acetyltransferase)
VVGEPGEDISGFVFQSGKTTVAEPLAASSEAAVAHPSVAKDQPAILSQSSIVNPQSSIPNLQSSILKASPLARHIAEQEHIDLAGIRGSGPGGRIVRMDVEAALAGKGAQVAAPVFSDGKDQTIPRTKLRLVIARRMAESKSTIPHFYVTHEYKVDSLMDLRSQYNRSVPEEKKISMNDFIVKAVALTLLQFPNLNTSLKEDILLQHGQVNIGVAVASEGGLLTVVCREADKKTIHQISNEVKEMAARVRSGKVKPEDIQGSTFTVSNLGMYEVESFSAIINPPEAAILAVGSARQVPVVEQGSLKIGWRMKATLAVDHRVSDGAEAARFLQALATYLEEPLRLLV